MVKEFTDGFANENLTEGKMGEDLMECVLWKAIDRARIHFRIRRRTSDSEIAFRRNGDDGEGIGRKFSQVKSLR